MANAIVVTRVQPRFSRNPDNSRHPEMEAKQNQFDQSKESFLCPTRPHGEASKVTSSLPGSPAQDILPRPIAGSPSSVRRQHFSPDTKSPLKPAIGMIPGIVPSFHAS